MYKKLICVLLCFLCVNLSACKPKNEEMENSSVSNTGSMIVQLNSCYYYYNYSTEKEMYSLFEYDTISKTTKELDCFNSFGNMYVIDNKIYYTCSYDSSEFSVKCYDGYSVSEEGRIKDNLYLMNGRRILTPECKLLIIDNSIIVNYNNKIYMKNKNQFEEICDDISTMCYSGGIIYYANTYGEIHAVTSKDNIILSRDKIEQNDFVSKLLGGEYSIMSMEKYSDYLYFIVGVQDAQNGKAVIMSLSDNSINVLGEQGGTYNFLKTSDGVYFINSKGVFYCDFRKTQSEYKLVPVYVNPKTFSLDVVNNELCYTLLNVDTGKFDYYKIQNEEDILMF